jgi:hypothetical protein
MMKDKIKDIKFIMDQTLHVIQANAKGLWTMQSLVEKMFVHEDALAKVFKKMRLYETEEERELSAEIHNKMPIEAKIFFSDLK